MWAIWNLPLALVSSAIELQFEETWSSGKKKKKIYILFIQKNFNYSIYQDHFCTSTINSGSGVMDRGRGKRYVWVSQWRFAQQTVEKTTVHVLISDFCFMNYTCSLWQCRQVLHWWGRDPAVTCNKDIHLGRWIPTSSLLLSEVCGGL